MKKSFAFFFAALSAVCVEAQSVPVTPVDNLSIYNGAATVTAPFELFSPYMGMGPVVVYNTAQVDFIAGQRVHLQPGFQAAQFTGNGYFHAQIGAAPDFDVVFIEPNEGYPQVGINEKLEIGMKLPDVIANQVQSFITNGNGFNPFDPEKISVVAHFTNGTEQFETYGFYYQDFIRDPAAMGPMQIYNWIPQPTEFNWRIRFAPRTLGIWNATISVYINGSFTASYSVPGLQFECIPSSNPGFLQVGSDERHLKFSTSGKSFFAIGQNIAWPDIAGFRGQEYSSQPLVYPGGVLDIHDWINSLADNRGNFVRFIVTPELGEIEWGKLGDYSAVASADTLDPHPSTGLMQAWELDQLFQLCETRDVYLMFNLVFQGEYNTDTPGSRGWSHNPYNLEIAGIDDPPDLFRNAQTNALVLKHLHNKHRYYLSRYGYSTSLGVLQLFSEFENWSQNEPLDSNAFFRDDAYDFLRTIAADVKANNSGANHLLAVSFGHEPWNFGSPGPHIFSSPDIDLTNFNRYPRERTAARELYKAYNHCTNCGPLNNQSLFGAWPDKPALITETGLFKADTITILLGGDSVNVEWADPGDISSCSDITFHNYMWSSAFNGGYGTALNWWQWFNNPYRENNFPAIAEFFSDIDFEANSYVNPGRWDDGLLSTSDNSILETVYLKSDNNEHAIGWVHNMSYWWGNVDQNCSDRHGLNMPIKPFEDLAHPGDYDDVWTNPQTAFDFPLIEGLTPGRYSVKQYSTRNFGGQMGSTITVWTDIFGRLMLPPLYNLSGDIPDYAVKADKDPLFNFRQSPNLLLDTLLVCQGDAIAAHLGMNIADVDVISLSWYLDEHFYSSLPEAEFYFMDTGMYHLKLSILLEDSSTLEVQQNVLVSYCDESENQRIALSSLTAHGSDDDIQIFPNPTTGLFRLQTAGDTLYSVIIYSVQGETILEVSDLVIGEYTLDMTDFENGVFLIEVRTNRERYLKKLVKID